MHILSGWEEWLSMNILVFSNLHKVRYLLPREEKNFTEIANWGGEGWLLALNF